MGRDESENFRVRPGRSRGRARINPRRRPFLKQVQERGQAYDLSQGGNGLRTRTLSAIGRRAQRLVEVGLATTKDGNIRVPVQTVMTLERQEVDRVGQWMASDRGLTFVPSSAGEHVSGRLTGVASLVSGRFAMIENGLGFQLVPWQRLLEKRIGQHIGGLQRDDGRIDWTFGRNRGLSL